MGIGNKGLTDEELRAAPADVAVTSSVLPTGATTEAKQDISNASLASIDTNTDLTAQTLLSILAQMQANNTILFNQSNEILVDQNYNVLRKA